MCATSSRSLFRYNHLVANLFAFYNVVAMTNAARRMEAEGFEVRDECVAELSPYQTEHINRFGHYALNFSRSPATPLTGFPETAAVRDGGRGSEGAPYAETRRSAGLTAKIKLRMRILPKL